MTIAELRSEMNLSLEAFAAEVGLKSKGQMQLIEKGAKPSVAVALRIEKLSGGRILASALNPTVAMIEEARAS